MSEESEIATPLDYVEYDFDSFNSTNTPDHPSAQSNCSWFVQIFYKFFGKTFTQMDFQMKMFWNLVNNSGTLSKNNDISTNPLFRNWWQLFITTAAFTGAFGTFFGQ